jgi:hypothetical protein
LAQRRTSGSHATPPATWRATIAINRKAGTPTSRPGTTKSSKGDWAAAGPPAGSGGCDGATGPAAAAPVGEPVGFGAADADVPDDPPGGAVAGPGVRVGSGLLGSGIDGDTDGTGTDGTGSDGTGRDGGGGGLAVGRVGSGVGPGGNVGTGGKVGIGGKVGAGGKVGTGGSVGGGKVGTCRVGVGSFGGGRVGTGTLGKGKVGNGSLGAWAGSGGEAFSDRAPATGVAEASTRPRPSSHPTPASLDVVIERPTRRG